MLTLADVVEGLRPHLVRPVPVPAGTPVRRFVIDSRQVEPGDVFIAFRGERTDGHRYVAEASRRGACAAIVESSVADAGIPLLQVDATLTALQDLAAWWRGRATIPVVGVTGSVGKTSTKEAIAGVLASRFQVLKNEANQNNEIGLPLTLLQLTPAHEVAVLEMGMYVPGDIRQLCRIARPAIGVVTNVGPVHLERVGSIEGIAAAKAELVESLPADGTAVLNADDARVRAMAHRTAARPLLYGLAADADVRAVDVESHGLDGVTFQLVAAGEIVPIHLPWPGRHSVSAALAAAAVGLTLGLSPVAIAAALAAGPSRPRLTVWHGRGGCTILDDSYNAAPASCLAALDLLAELPGCKVAILGDMFELGAAEESGHRAVGKRAGEVADVVVAVGMRARWIAEEASRAGRARVSWVATKEAALPIVDRLLSPESVLLVKGSRGMQMETIVEHLVEPARRSG